jgi:hypothetical protein
VIVVAKMLPAVEKVPQKLDEHGMRSPGPAKYKNGLGYYNDLALRAFFGGGVYFRPIAYLVSGIQGPHVWS